MKYDYLVVGSGLYGAVFAHEAKKKGKTCLVIDKRPHIGGNIYCENIEGINVHKYGAHIFHTSNKKVWDYINQFAEFNNYINSPVAIYKDELYNLPFNMNTFSKMWNIKTPQEAKDMIAKQVAETGITEPKNLEEQGLSLVGKDVFEKLVKGYTEKQWGRACKDLPAFIIKRLPVRFTFDNNYFNDRYQGIPIGGYTKIIEKMLDGIEVKTDTDYFEFIKENPDIAEKTLFTGMIDEYFGYKLGALEYRSVRFETEVLETDNYQGNAVVNYTEKQWGRACKDLPAFIIKRLPVRFTFDNNYFNDRYQGIPIGGYTKIIEKMLDGIEVKTDTDYFEFIKENPDIAEKTLFTGMIDEYFGYKLGALEYRSVRFETEVLDTDNYQGNAVVNYTEREVPYTRIIEHKHFEFGKQEKTVISREYSSEWKVGMEPYYPVNNEQNNKLFEEYRKLAEQEKNVIFGGRLGNYKYYDMDKVIEAALEMVAEEL